MIEAAAHLDAGLPEVFAGYDRAETLFPVAYPTASSPQAWATASTFVWIRSIIGLGSDGTRTAPPEDGESLTVEGLTYRGARVDV